MSTDFLHITQGSQGLRALLARAAGMDPAALVRLRALPGGQVDAFVTTPFDVVAARRVRGSVSGQGGICHAQQLAQTLAEVAAASAADAADASDCELSAELPAAAGGLWPGALPPHEGFELVDTLPVAVVRELADQGQALARQFSGPQGPPVSLLNQNVVTVSSGAEGAAGAAAVQVPMRMIFAATSLGLIPGPGAPAEVPRQVRVSARGSWVRLDAAFGTVYHSRRLNLLT